MIYRKWGKRFIDIAFSVLALLLLSPLLLLTGLAVGLSSSGSVLFLQERIGMDGRSFRLFKYRTMYVNPTRTIAQTHSRDPDITPIGKVLRRLKIDELPQLLNIIVGDMSIVGPRPCMAETVAGMPEWAKHRFHIRPGLTGLAQINGNITLSWEERWKYDVQYGVEYSLMGDIKIILKTIWVIVRGESHFRKVL